jgi:hypothetical protein
MVNQLLIDSLDFGDKDSSGYKNSGFFAIKT